ncbi:putative rhodanese-related sulfurtransferase [Buchnera aphidicola str. Ak (Acyrthosiphon kondoi)]|uniref:Putative rhodanese-related sulfurtransferase n=1 Tax=Buchnera aphidicola str. Ak (Acyrthosiphon kondoi) TaxID=1005090 RepID=G2LMD2_9GAMM|nr:rhodanese-like domain-containing protein [Buchnera aphidicola]AEO08420.1 putative rhodanese-related sulfurtransferase [Buchnera aphidicola str. Ak (Acyrthosiphon kondoi)]WAI18223.1 MAG: rhodanese-like domain-containing protein [Buchnera aphidicola (Acyrthosiphon caraganae)]
MQDLVFFISEHIILFSIWFFCLIGVVFFLAKNIFLKYKIINNFQAIKLINQEKAIVIDTRSSKHFKEGHIVNSINIPLQNIFSGNIKEIKIYKFSPIILVLNETYGDNKCINEFLKHGFKNIYILKNGIYYWNIDHLPLVTEDK